MCKCCVSEQEGNLLPREATVSATGRFHDGGRQCTLRAAIQEANNTSGADTIEFDIGDTSTVKTISPASQLPKITDALTIDGYTQEDASPNTLAEGNDAVLNIVLDGLDAGSVAVGLRVDASDTTIKGLVIRRFSDYGVFIYGLGDQKTGLRAIS